jgi:alpha-tubulin suppressor-like RCC1 family protein
VCTPRSIGIVSLVAAGLLLNLGCSEDVTAPTLENENTASAALAATATPLSLRQITSGEGHACGVTPEGQAYCWGDNRYGQLGNGIEHEGGGPCDPSSAESALNCSTRPVAVVGGHRFLDVSAGARHTCGIDTERVMYCWGSNTRGEAGNGYVGFTGSPTRLNTALRFRAVTAGHSHTCAITMSDVAFCWGFNDEGQLGIGSISAANSTPRQVAGNLRWRQMSVGIAHTCGVTTTLRAYCWGANRYGALGNGSTTRRTAPVAVASSMQFLRISAGGNVSFLEPTASHTCAINIGHRAFCWGNNSHGQLGDGTLTQRLTPTAVAGTRVFERVSASADFTCAVTRTGQGVCWGKGSSGQLGNGTTSRRALPTPVSGGLVFKDISAGGAYSCGVTTSARAYCWGLNFWGNLGDGTQTARLTPTPVAGI